MGNDEDQVRESIDGAGLDRVQLNAMIQQILVWESFELVNYGVHKKEDLGNLAKFYPNE